MNDKQKNFTPPPHLMGVLRSLWQWRKPIIFTTIAGTLLAVIISLLLPVYFQAGTSFLALNPAQNSIAGVFGGGNREIDIYGNGDDIDRLTAIAESDQLVDFMVRKFNLYEVYDIDSTKIRATESVAKEFMDNYEVQKTPRDILELSILDASPERAAAMATAAREKINELSVNLIKATQQRTAGSLQGELDLREKSLESINEELKKMRSKSGIYDTQAQGEALATQSSTITGNLARTRAKLNSYRQRGGRGARDSIAKLEVSLAGLESSRMVLDTQLTKLNESIGPLNSLEEERSRLNNALTYDRIRLKQLKTLLRTEQRALEVVEEAKEPVVKAKPKRSVIVLVGMIFSFLAALIGILIIEGGRKFDWKEITR